MLHTKRHLATATICIALGVAAVMPLINSIGEYLRPVSPESNIDRIMSIYRMKSEMKEFESTSYSSISLDFAKRYLSTTKTQGLSSIYSEGRFPRLDGVSTKDFSLISCDACYWQIFDFKFVQGRPFTGDEFANRANVAVISKSLYTQLTDIEKKNNRISYNGKDLSIVGVVHDANSYRIFTNASLWIPYSIFAESEKDIAPTGGYKVVYLLKSAKDKKRMVAEVAAVEQRYNTSSTNKYKVTIAKPRTKLDILVYGYSIEDDKKSDFYIRWGSTILIFLLLPVLNLTILNYNQIIDRYAEMATMRSFGASKKDIVVYFMASNSMVVLVGSTVGYLLSFLFSRLYQVAAFDIEKYSDIPFDGHAYPSVYSLAFVIGIVLTVSFVSGILPALKLARMNISRALKGGEL